MVKNFWDSLFNSSKSSASNPESIELKIMGQKVRVPIEELNLEEIIYKFGGVEINTQIRVGQHGMIHHCFDTEEKANSFLEEIKKIDLTGLSEKEKEGFKKARVTKTDNEPTYTDKGVNFYRIRLSLAQFQFFSKKFAHQDDANPKHRP